MAKQKHKVVFIGTRNHLPIFAKTRKLSSGKVAAAKLEFQKLQAGEIITPFNSE